MAPTVLVLLIACANLANLLLARASRRGREMATRLALGASRGRLVRQLMTESILLALLGGTAGTLFAAQLLRSASQFLAGKAANMGIALPAFCLDAEAWGFALAISLVAAITCGLAPALNASRWDLSLAARQDAGGTRGSRVRNALMIAQVAVCTLLLSAAGLMLRSFQQSLSTDPGFATDRVIAIKYNLGTAGYSGARAASFRRRLYAQLQSSPHVLAHAAAAAPPLSDRPTLSLLALDGAAGARTNSPFNCVSPEYFQLLGIPIVEGRTFNAAEIVSGAAVAMVSRATARRLWSGQSVLGKRFQVEDEPTSPMREVIGVTADTRSVWLSRVDENYIYLPVDPAAREQSALLVRLDRDTEASRSELSSAIHSIDADLPVSIQPMREALDQWRLLPLAGSALAMCLAMVGLTLAGVGMYGVMSYLVSQRKREFGIRMALGAGKPAILSMVFRQGFRVVLVGLGLGWIGAVALARVLMGSFYGLSPYDPPAYIFVVGFLGAAALASMYGPANRASNVDPVASLREE
ncbi:MAG: FtsX-like permease family protein [Candidatus Solibacter sp.]